MNRPPLRTKTVKVMVAAELHELIVQAAVRENRKVSDVGRVMFELLTDEYVVKSAKKAGMPPTVWIRSCVKP